MDPIREIAMEMLRGLATGIVPFLLMALLIMALPDMPEEEDPEYEREMKEWREKMEQFKQGLISIEEVPLPPLEKR